MSQPSLIQRLTTPVLASVLEHRLESAVLVGLGGLQAGLAFAHLPGWQCPIKAALGIPCPGCGLSTAIAELLHGQVHAALETHAFAPLFLLVLVVMLVVVVLPQAQRQRAIAVLAGFERRTAGTAIALGALFIYWGFRLLPGG